MSIAVWDPKYATGHAEVDAQHQQLFSLFNALHAATLEGRPQAVLAQTIESLNTYVGTHFQLEQDLMRAHHYPDRIRHCQCHAELTARTRALHAGLEQGSRSVTAELVMFMTAWLRHHIACEDMALVEWIRAERAQDAATG